jgi:hypothetical protein
MGEPAVEIEKMTCIGLLGSLAAEPWGIAALRGETSSAQTRHD